ncbi:winged helix DNA-binding protein [Qipengyuania sediminis]|uniref:winged helix DNA-binding protein n=1 Tax=Qipengyuania sediminis TaxID=1532023 RepID=UPI00105A0981|nr:winged helix DNA-binding protein [Qipengyuania sediminis]
MTQAAYLCEGTGPSGAKAPAGADAPTVSLFGEDDLLLELAEEAGRAGLPVRHMRPLHDGLEDDDAFVGDICVVDCRALGAAGLAALVRLDERAARQGAEVVALTNLTLLEEAFGCLETARTQFLVDPRPSERLLALTAAAARRAENRVRELDEADRLAMLRLTQGVGRLAAKLDRMALPLGEDAPGAMSGRLASPALDFRAENAGDKLRRPRVPLPDPRLVKQIIRQRRLRARYFEPELFADPAWDILLDLTAARAEHRRVSVTSLCIAAAVPATTALRWITQMTEMGLLLREQDPEDRRRAFIVLADPVADAMARYFDELGKDAGRLI